MIPDSRQFLSLLSELSCAASQSTRHRMTPFERQGWADFIVHLPAPYARLIVECKKVFPDTKSERIPKLVYKANRQIKATGVRGSGLLVIDLSDRVPVNLEPHDKPKAQSRLPIVVCDMADAASKAMRRHNTSVAGTVLFWDEYEVLGNPASMPRSMLVLRRLSHVVRHQNPKRALPADDDLFKVAHSYVMWVEWSTGGSPIPE